MLQPSQAIASFSLSALGESNWPPPKLAEDISYSRIHTMPADFLVDYHERIQKFTWLQAESKPAKV
ncbi:hypothetical protein SAMN05216419_102316 [Nitrosomonas cryotolerans]|uniref:Uncharacterized protein n=1 Tax=Nitrosomonas cryotolerans ATCC 49181 TaxID=1131553 RepID=A0A1N6I8W5_9PROT|nr:hypothetical protein [Nitrosomonas cryotolerans]SFP83257.1 hypothetical protein SAMN05216419_102316 [Nitrosomonas cryotolerans]SIO28478.1 hypothetical protein SAMN02743940_1640 [Nitrosomonas cryotolerans ATCC 49181]